MSACSINGVDVKKHVNTLRLFETLSKPWLTGQLGVYDTNNILENMGLVGGEPISFTIETTRSSRSETLHLLAVKGETSSQGLRGMQYTIELIGKQYFGDRANLVQQSFKGATATDIASKIAGQFMGGLDVKVGSVGLIGKDNPYIVSSVKPLKAITDVMKLATFGAYDTGNVAHWADRDGVHMAPLEHLFKTIGVQERFFQEATWGKSWTDIARAEYAIIAASALVNPEAGRASASLVSATNNQERKVLDTLTNKKLFDQMASKVAAGAAAGTGAGKYLGSLFSSAAGGHGGSHNYYMNDSATIPNQSAHHTEKEKAYGAQVANGPQWTIKVPIQPGLRCVVGQGINCKLLPPIGDQTSSIIAAPQTGGDMLIIDAMHEIKLDDVEMAGTSTFRTAKGGYSQS